MACQADPGIWYWAAPGFAPPPPCGRTDPSSESSSVSVHSSGCMRLFMLTPCSSEGGCSSRRCPPWNSDGGSCCCRPRTGVALGLGSGCLRLTGCRCAACAMAELRSASFCSCLMRIVQRCLLWPSAVSGGGARKFLASMEDRPWNGGGQGTVYVSTSSRFPLTVIRSVRRPMTTPPPSPKAVPDAAPSQESLGARPRVSVDIGSA
mmetsp:Transcript_76339/g.223846  ORF Transcript_76339/g.223846 Transcript_76339/m.223846 type:complete len:206 (-) Transcript_76339:320-937(-)